MRSHTRTLAFSLGLALAACAAQAAGTVQVNYIQPDKFTDLGQGYHPDRSDTLRELTRHFEALAERHLAAGQKLRIEVLDIDLAGQMRHLRRYANDVRVVNGRVDWPLIKLRYTLESPGEPVRSGEHKLSDMAYLQRINRYASGDSLRYEKHMLDDWFALQFSAAGAK